MSRIPKWKNEKTKVKMVFRLQFQATHIPQPGWDKVFVSLFPTDSGKPTAKTTKTTVKNGSCKWSDPIYETTRLLQDPSTKFYEEKLYKLVVAMGSSRSSLLGEVVINLADFVDALRPSSVALLLRGCDFGTILQVTVQLLTSKIGFREFEQQREHSVKSLQASAGKIFFADHGVSSASFRTTERIATANARAKLKSDSIGLPSLQEACELDEEYQDSAAGVDSSSQTSECLHAEKNDIFGFIEHDVLESTVSSNVIGYMPIHNSSKVIEEQIGKQLSNDWSLIDNELPSICEGSDLLVLRFQVAEAAISQLKSEAKLLQNMSDELSSEAQTLAQLLAMDLASKENMAREINILKSECQSFKNDLDELRTPSAMPIKFFLGKAMANHKFGDNAPDTECYNLPCDLLSKFIQGVFLIECKVKQIQNKACFKYNGNKFGYICLDFNDLDNLIQSLKQIIAQNLSLEAVDGIHKKSLLSEKYSQEKETSSCLTDLYFSEGVKENVSEFLKQLELTKTADESFANRMAEMDCYYESLIHELEERQKQTSDHLENLMVEHSSCFYTISNYQKQTEKLQEEMNEQLIKFDKDRHNLESFIKELEERAISSEVMLSKVQLNCAIAVDQLQNDLKLLSSQVLSMYEANESLIKRAFTDSNELYYSELSEEMQISHTDELSVFPSKRKQKIYFDKIQPDILANCDHELSAIFNCESGMLSNKMLCTFFPEEKCKVAPQADVSMDLKLQINEEQNSLLHPLMNKEWSNRLHNPKVPKPIDYSLIPANVENTKYVYYYFSPENQLTNFKDDSDKIKMPFDMQKQLQVTSEAEPLEIQMLCLNWKIYAQALQETLRELFSEFGNLSLKVIDLQEKLKHCEKDNEFLFSEMQVSLDETRILREADAKCNTRCNDLVSKIHSIEVKLNDALDENSFLVQEKAYCQSLIAEYRVFENKFEECFAEKLKIENILKEETSQREYFQRKIRLVNEELMTLKEQFDMECSLNNNFKRDVAYLEDKLGDLCNCTFFCFQNTYDSIFDDGFAMVQLDSKDYDAVVSHLIQFQQKVSRRLLSLQNEKKVAEERLEIAQHEVNERESQVLYIKQRFEIELVEAQSKLEHSNNLTQHLQTELQAALEEIRLRKEAEESHILENKKLQSNVSLLTAELQQSAVECRNFRDKLLAVEGVNEELSSIELKLTDIMHENRHLLSSIKISKEASSKMENELSRLKGSLHITHDELQYERKTRENLEVLVASLELQTIQISQQLLSFNEQNDEICFFRKRVLDLERDVREYALFCKEREGTIKAETAGFHLNITNMENQFLAALEHSISADVELLFIKIQLYSKTADLNMHEQVSKRNFEELYLNYLDTIKVPFDEKERILAYIESSKINQAEYENCKLISAIPEAYFGSKKQYYDDEICMLNHMLMGQGEFEELQLSKWELDIIITFLRLKLSEYETQLALFDECKCELSRLREQHIALNQKLSEQILKTEEYKNLFSHFRELKGKADTECLQACKRRELEGSHLVTQESLRIAFIKEQYESQIKEMRNECSVSRKYAKGMLLKLQNSLDDNESRKKNEASLGRRNDEMLTVLSDMETELQIVLADRTELNKAFDRIKSELECTILSLECCKEEKLKIQNSLKESNNDRDKVRIELDLVKRLLENMALTTGHELRRNYEVDKLDATLIGELLDDGLPSMPVVYYDETLSALGICAKDQVAKVAGESITSMTLESISVREVRDVNITNVKLEDFLRQPAVERIMLLENNATHIADIKEYFKEQQRLMTGMELLHKELVILRNENLSSELLLRDNNLDTDLHGSNRGLLQLDMANEQLGSSYSNEIERGIALETETLEVKKSGNHMQSDDETVFQSMRDINELIRNMIELKKRNSAVESELQEMHDRYSQLSLQFAEVEGERQKLVMSLKHRTPKKL